MYDPAAAVALVKEAATAKFDETVELHLRTGLDGRHADQQIRGTVVLPHGLGKVMRVVVFAEGEILSFIHKDPPVPVADVIAGANQCIVDGLWGMVQKVGVPSELLICGGVARNAGIVKAIEARLGKPVLLPKQPQYVRALGAAVFARQIAREGVAS